MMAVVGNVTPTDVSECPVGFAIT